LGAEGGVPLRRWRPLWWLVLGAVFTGVVAITLVLPWEREAFHCELAFEPAVVLPGDLVGLTLNSPRGERMLRVAGVSARVLDLEPRFFRQGQAMVALVGIPSTTPPGRYELEVEVLTTRGELYPLLTVVEVGERQFPVQHLQAGQTLTALLTAANLAEDRAKTTAARATPVTEPLWEGPFLMPVEGRLTTDYGQRRYINHAPSGNPHSGLDIAAPQGTPVTAAARGVVTFAGDLHVSGKTVILDHGLNLFTLYLHLSTILVEVGQEVPAGHAIGRVGSTGFSTGPHLHWTVSVGLVPVNPWFVLERDPLELLGEPAAAIWPDGGSCPDALLGRSASPPSPPR